MEHLKALFKVRDEHFTTHSTKILNEIRTTLECVTNFLADVDDSISQGAITWEEATLMDDLMIVLGSVNYKPGTTPYVNGVQVPITEENCAEIQQLVHMSLPLELVISNDREEIMKYLYSEIEGFENMEDMVEAVTQSDVEFDLSDLTEEQRQALKFSTVKGGH